MYYIIITSLHAATVLLVDLPISLTAPHLALTVVHCCLSHQYKTAIAGLNCKCSHKCDNVFVTTWELNFTDYMCTAHCSVTMLYMLNCNSALCKQMGLHDCCLVFTGNRNYRKLSNNKMEVDMHAELFTNHVKPIVHHGISLLNCYLSPFMIV